MDLNMTEFQKLGPNVTGFQLMNRSDPAVEKINQDWLDFDSKDLKLARRKLKVNTDSNKSTDTRLGKCSNTNEVLHSEMHMN